MDDRANTGGGHIWYLPWNRERHSLEPLFKLADDSIEQIRRYRDYGDVITAITAKAEAIGHVQVISTGPCEFELKSIAVLENHRRCGIGSALLRTAIRRYRALGAQRVKVSTSIASFDAIRFYLRHGFRARAIVRDAFSIRNGYRPDAMIDGLPLNDALELEIVLGESEDPASRGS